jgi:subtilase family serine protease
MKATNLIFRCLGLTLALTPTSTLLAKSVSLAGEHQPGQARKHLWLNLTPATSTSYNPTQIRHAYGVDQLSAAGAGETIGIVDAYGSSTIQSDLNTFCTQWGLPQTTVQIVGGSSTADANWALETALDVEWAHAIAPQARIVLSVANSSSVVDLLNAINSAVSAGATVISMSWGGGEWSSESAYESYFNVSGVTFTASSGDNGAGVEWPACSPHVVGVGGTSLYLDSSNNRTSETAWSGSGGGISAYFAQPSFQSGWITASGRGVPDVAMVADPNTGVYVVSAGTWYVVGGTSAAAPQWAALIALANSLRSSGTISAADAVIYPLAQGSTTTPYAVNPAYFYDVSQGSNGNSAAPPYDLVTGLGTPMAAALVPTLAGGSGTTPNFSLSVTPAFQSVAVGAAAHYTVTVSPSGGFNGTVAFSFSGLPLGATSSFTPGSVTGSGSSTLTVSGAPAGSYTLTITGTSGSLTHSVTATLTVTSPDFSLAVTPASQGVAVGASANYTVAVSPSSGFNGTVAFSVSGLPLGATGSFTPGSVTGSGSSTLTVSGAPAGSYTLTITGTSGSLTHSVTATLTVSNPDFSISVSPSSRSVKAGNPTSYAVAVSSIAGFTGSVALSVTGLPSGATASFSPTTLTGSGSSTLTVTTQHGGVRGTFSLTVTGISSTKTHSVGASLTIR